MEESQTYEPSIGLRLLTIAALPGLWALIAGMIVLSELKRPSSLSGANMYGVIPWALVFVAAVAVSAFFYSEKIVLNSVRIVRRSVFGERVIPLASIIEAKCVRFGRGNTVLRIKTSEKASWMGIVMKTRDIESIVSYIDTHRHK